MMYLFRYRRLVQLLVIGGCLIFISSLSSRVLAVVNPQSGSVGLEGTIGAPPPTQGATITAPSNNQSFTTGPITVAGLCPNGLLVKVFANNVFVGSTVCKNGSFSLQISLFNGRNDIDAIVYDSLDQAGPTSNTVTVNFQSAQFGNSGPLLSLTSEYAERGADPGQSLTWPIIINSGTSPFALSIDWGDGSHQLLSESFGGTVNLSHTYQNAGTYTITILATDANGQPGFLQVVGVVNGPVKGSSAASGSSSTSTTKVITKYVWWPAAMAIPLIAASFWLGRRHELFTLRRRLENTEA